MKMPLLLQFAGIMTTDEVGREYLKETNMMFISGIIVALAIEHCGLHKRIALNCILMIGTSPRKYKVVRMNSEKRSFTHYVPHLQVDAGHDADHHVPLHVAVEHGDDGHDGTHCRRRPPGARKGENLF